MRERANLEEKAMTAKPKTPRKQKIHVPEQKLTPKGEAKKTKLEEQGWKFEENKSLLGWEARKVSDDSGEELRIIQGESLASVLKRAGEVEAEEFSGKAAVSGDINFINQNLVALEIPVDQVVPSSFEPQET